MKANYLDEQNEMIDRMERKQRNGRRGQAAGREQDYLQVFCLSLLRRRLLLLRDLTVILDGQRREESDEQTAESGLEMELEATGFRFAVNE